MYLIIGISPLITCKLSETLLHKKRMSAWIVDSMTQVEQESLKFTSEVEFVLRKTFPLKVCLRLS